MPQTTDPRVAGEQLTTQEMLRFFSVLSHDLKSPIFSIDGFSELLLADYRGKIDAEGEDFLQRIRSSAQQMKKVIDEMSHMVKLLSRPAVTRSTDLKELVEELRLKHTYLLEQCGATLHAADNLPQIETDPEFLKEALGALIKNAAFFSDRESGARDIWLEVTESPSSISITVRDNGIGVDPRYIEQLFDLGLKLDKSRGGGPGYGLFLARKIATILGGTLEASSNPGEGSTFTLTLPR